MPEDSKPLNLPMCERLRACHATKLKIMEFLDWMAEQHDARLYNLHKHNTQPAKRGSAKHTEDGCWSWDPDDGIAKPRGRWRIACGMHNDDAMPPVKRLEQYIHEFFEIDDVQLENERRALLDSLQPPQTTTTEPEAS